MITFLLTFLLAIMLVGIPILLCIALIGFIGIALIPELVMPLFAQKMFAQLDSFTLLAMPYFILAGSIMTAGGISRQLVDFARALVGHFRAGLAHASIVASMAVAGVSGSSTADAASQFARATAEAADADRAAAARFHEGYARWHAGDRDGADPLLRATLADPAAAAWAEQAAALLAAPAYAG